MNSASFDIFGRLSCSVDQLHGLVQEKLLGKIETGAGMRGAFKVFGPSPEGIGLTRFKSMLHTIGLALSEKDALRLFAKYDDDGSGHIDMYELVRNILPRDYSCQTWSSKNFDKQQLISQSRNNIRKKMGAKYHSATLYPKGLRQQMEPSKKDVEKMIRFKIESNAKDGTERGYALQMFGRPINGISRPNMKRALERHSIPCSDEVLDEIFDSLQVCGLVKFDTLWKSVMPVDGRVSIGAKNNFPSSVQDAHLCEHRRKRNNKQINRNKALSQISDSQSLPSLDKNLRTFTINEIKNILFERFKAHHNAENFSLNAFHRRREISFRTFCHGLKRLGVPATKKQASLLFSEYDHNTGLVNHRAFFQDITNSKSKKMGFLEKRTNNALYLQQRGWTPLEKLRKQPEINVRVTSAAHKNGVNNRKGKIQDIPKKQHTNLNLKKKNCSNSMTDLNSHSKHRSKRKKKKNPFYNIIYKQTKIW